MGHISLSPAGQKGGRGRCGVRRLPSFPLSGPLPQRRRGNGSQRPRAFLDLLGLKRSEEHTSELQSLMRSSYDVFCWKKNSNITIKTKQPHKTYTPQTTTSRI